VRLAKKREAPVAGAPNAKERRSAVFTAVAEVVDALNAWLHTDMSSFKSTTHDYGRGEHLSGQLVVLVAVLIEADRANGGNGTGDANEFRS
jgi:hypothetical protein